MRRWPLPGSIPRRSCLWRPGEDRWGFSLLLISLCPRDLYILYCRFENHIVFPLRNFFPPTICQYLLFTDSFCHCFCPLCIYFILSTSIFLYLLFFLFYSEFSFFLFPIHICSINYIKRIPRGVGGRIIYNINTPGVWQFMYEYVCSV
jgi:hypothetical protein